MLTITIRIPDDKHSRLKALAQYKHISLNKLMEELSTVALAEFDSEIRLALKRNKQTGLDLLDKLDSHFM